MISKRVFISAAHDNYARLAAYIAEAGPSDEKCLMHWCSGMLGGDEYQEGIPEAMDVQRLNTRAAAKTYHLVISFRPEDEAKMTPQTFKAIEERFAAALGYTDHQRHCGVHKNTANLHMHMAYNMIHPEKLTCHKEFRDFWIRDRVCRNIEREFGLTVDNGIVLNSSVQTQTRPRTNEKAQLVEAHTGQQSFDSYAKAHRESIIQTLESAASWQEVHETLAAYGMEIKPHGNGLAIKDQHGNYSIKASAIDRSLSMRKLEEHFGSYQPPHNLDHIQERFQYTAVPLHRSPERGQLFAEYQTGIEIRKTTLQNVKEREDAALAAIRAEWTATRRELENKNIAKKNLRRLLQLARKHEAEAIAKTRLNFQESRNVVRREVPFTSWNKFLQYKAERGTEIALAVLRSRDQIIPHEHATAPSKNWEQHGQSRVIQATKERALFESAGISTKGKNCLQSVMRMRQVFQENGYSPDNLQHRVDHKGVVLFSFKDGGSIRDSGKYILFSLNNENAKQIALLYAQKKWGKQRIVTGNRITQYETPERNQTIER